MIAVNDKVPAGQLQQRIADKVINHSSDDLFRGKKVLVFALPGAFTPTCSNQHLPGFVRLSAEFKAKGIDSIICLSVNDVFVMQAWGEQQQANDIMMLADGDASFSTALGLVNDSGSFGGMRSKRYAMIVENGIVTALHIDPPKTFEHSSAEAMLAQLN